VFTVVTVYFIIDSVRELFDTPSYYTIRYIGEENKYVKTISSAVT